MKNIVLLAILLATTRQDDWGWSWAMLDADSIRLPSAIRESTEQDLRAFGKLEFLPASCRMLHSRVWIAEPLSLWVR